MKLKIAFLLLIPILGFSQLSTKVDSLYTIINAKDQVKNGKIGMGSDATVYLDYEDLYTKLDSIATDDEIIYIAEKGNEVIKTYMCGILVNRKSKYLSRLFSQYLFNNKEIHIQAGCTGYQTSFAGELYSDLFYQKNKIDEIEMYRKEYTIEEIKKYHLPFETKWTKPEVDSLLVILNKIVLSNDNVLPTTLRHIFTLNKFKFDNHERVKYFAEKYPEREILATLASFQNKKDLPFFHQNIDNSFIAISKFPDKSFIKPMQDKYEKNIQNIDYYEAISSLCFDETNVIKNNIFDKLSKSENIFDQEYIQYLETSLKKYDCKFNTELLKEITEFYNR